ncbi:MAG: hypothetical protein MI923_16030 [Phycisphaerales bacterium]|nr:hypothetical protein [Phycisphaerales bacterium]
MPLVLLLRWCSPVDHMVDLLVVVLSALVGDDPPLAVLASERLERQFAGPASSLARAKRFVMWSF